MSAPRLLLYCQHSLGIGHLTRSFAFATELARNFEVVLANGGPLPPGVARPPGVEIVDLPPLGMHGTGALVSRDARSSLGNAKQLRRAQLLGLLQSFRPDALLIELFPFGRKKFAYELLPLLKSAHRLGALRPLVISSLRDILVAARTDQLHHDNRARWLCNRYFDAVLVHADPKLARLEDTFRPSRPLRTHVHYTGFVAPARMVPSEPQPRRNSILVSAGGGSVGYSLLSTALQAHSRLDSRTRPRLELIAGPFMPEPQWQQLLETSRDRADVKVERVVPDLATRMRGAAMSLSQCGYNTAMDILAAGVPALVVPFCEGGEDEQTNRARRLAALQLMRVLEGSALEPSVLAREIELTLVFRPQSNGLDMQGAANGARWLVQRLEEHRSSTQGRRVA